MKNFNLLRLAGFGFFGAASLSPTAEQNKWLLEKLDVAKNLPCVSTSISAFYREDFVIEEKSADQFTLMSSKPNILFSLFIKQPPPDSIQPLMQADESMLETAHIGGENLAANYPQPFKNIVQIPGDLDLKIKSEAPITDSADLILTYTPADKGRGTINSGGTITIEKNHLPWKSSDRYLNDKFKLLPPTNFVDAPLVKKSPRSKIYSPTPIITTKTESGIETYPAELLQERTEDLTAFARKNDYSTEYAFIINLGLKSGKKRFFLVDLRSGTIIYRGLVAHGRGKEQFTLKKHYSNMPGSSCSSLGLYKVGGSYNGGFGKSFRLIGLEKSNSNAVSRAIVLHAMNCIPNEEIDYPICQSEGCPSISPELLEKITPVIRKSSKPILLWVFDSTIEEKHIP